MTTRETYGKRATRGFAWNHFYKLSEFGLLNIYTLLVARYFGPVDSTPFVVYAAAGTSLSLIGAFAVDGVLLRYLPRLSEAGESAATLSLDGVTNVASLLRKLLAFRLISILVLVSLLLLGVVLLYPESQGTIGSFRTLLPPISIFLLAQAVIAFSSFALMGLMQTKFVFFCSLITRSMLVSLIAILMATDTVSINSAILLHLGSAVLYALTLIASLNKAVKGVEEERSPLSVRAVAREIVAFLRKPISLRTFLITPVMLYGLTTWGNDVLSLVLGRQSDILLMRGMLGEATPDVGYYNVASLVLLFTEYVFLLGLGGALLTVFSKLAYDDEQSGAPTGVQYSGLNRGRAEVAAFQTVMLLPLCSFMFVFALSVLRVLYGPLYDASTEMVQHGVLALGINIALFHGGMQITSLVAIGKQKLVLKNRIFWAAVNIVANYFLIRSYGALGAIIGTNWANTCACATEWYFARKYIGEAGKVASVLRIAAISIVSALAVKEFAKLLEFSQSELMPLVAAGLLFLGLVLGLFYLLRVPETTIVLSRFKKAFAS